MIGEAKKRKYFSLEDIEVFMPFQTNLNNIFRKTSCNTTKTQEMSNREINEDTGRSEHSKALFQ